MLGLIRLDVANKLCVRPSCGPDIATAGKAAKKVVDKPPRQDYGL
jgi:hypothetical protein